MTKPKHSALPIYAFALTWLILSLIFPMYRVGGLLTVVIISVASGLICSGALKAKAQKDAPPEPEPEESYGPAIDPIVQEGKRAMGEMDRLRSSIANPVVRDKITKLMDVTGKIVRDAIDDPSDVPQIKKFMNYYLPTTIKLLNSYDRMSGQGIQGDNLTKTMRSIEDMLDTAIEAYNKQLDSLFANQALDIETDIDVMNQMLAREGLSGNRDFDVTAQDTLKK